MRCKKGEHQTASLRLYDLSADQDVGCVGMYACVCVFPPASNRAKGCVHSATALLGVTTSHHSQPEGTTVPHPKACIQTTISRAGWLAGFRLFSFFSVSLSLPSLVAPDGASGYGAAGCIEGPGAYKSAQRKRKTSQSCIALLTSAGRSFATVGSIE